MECSVGNIQYRLYYNSLLLFIEFNLNTFVSTSVYSVNEATILTGCVTEGNLNFCSNLTPFTLGINKFCLLYPWYCRSFPGTHGYQYRDHINNIQIWYLAPAYFGQDRPLFTSSAVCKQIKVDKGQIPTSATFVTSVKVQNPIFLYKMYKNQYHSGNYMMFLINHKLCRHFGSYLCSTSPSVTNTWVKVCIYTLHTYEHQSSAWYYDNVQKPEKKQGN